MTRILFLLLLMAGAARADDWEERWYNPNPAPGDLVLPIPCGGAMAFRPVVVPLLDNPLSDRAVTLGEPQGDQGYIDYQRNSFLAAPFPAGASARQFFMGKYDVTADQYAAIRGQPCPVPSPGGRLPQVRVSWFDAVGAGAQLSSWWLAHARDKLPRRGDALGYARLPTEDEWEYAARGGAAVSEADFLARTWPAPEGIEAYAQAGSRATGGKAQQVGRLKPNPLGLYDMLGNVQQMTLDPFRLNRVGRFQGQAGGVVVRGGDYTTPPATLDTAMRQEIPPFDARTGQPTVLPTVGFRFVLSAPSVGSLPETEAARTAFAAELGRNAQLPDDPAQLLSGLRDGAATDGERRGLDRLGAAMADLRRGQADRERAGMLAQLEAASVMANFVWNLDNVSRFIDRLADTVSAGRPDEQKMFHDLATRRREQLQPTLDGYLRLVRGLATSPQASEIESQSGVLREEFAARQQAQLTSLLAIATRHAAARRDGQTLPRDKALADILAVPVTR